MFKKKKDNEINRNLFYALLVVALVLGCVVSYYFGYTRGLDEGDTGGITCDIFSGNIGIECAGSD